MGRRDGTLSILLRARRAARGITNRGCLPQGLSSRLRPAVKLANLWSGVPLDGEQRRAIDKLQQATEALERAVAERQPDELTSEEIEYDAPLRQLIGRRDRAVRRAIRAGLAAHPAIMAIIQSWMAAPGREVPKGWRRSTRVSRETGPRKSPTLSGVRQSAFVRRIIDEEGLDEADAEAIRREFVKRLRKLVREGGPDLDWVGGKEAARAMADRFTRRGRDSISPQAWHKHLQKLLDN